MHQVDRALTSIETLLKALLDISRLDSGVVAPTMATVSLGGLLGDLKADFAAVAERRGLRLVVVPSRLCVTSDAALLGRILRNL
ncbi:hypothetical protein J8J27_30195, partial [Mycobacterium tuberculosis]|nr:hypothetical protein [Mycobacterium tuberculosis]